MHAQSLIHENIISYENVNIVHSLDDQSSKSVERASMLKPHIRSVIDYKPKPQAQGSHSPATRRSQHSFDQLIKQNIKKKEKQKKMKLNEEKSKQL